MREYPVTQDRWGEAITIIPHLSWKRSDQIRLAECYLSRVPLGSARAYQAFAKCMSVPLLLSVLRKYPPVAARKSLYDYHVAPVLRAAAKTAGDRASVEHFLASPFE